MTTQMNPMVAMRHTLEKMRTEFSSALPPQIPVEKFIRTTITAVQMNPDLLNADRTTLLGCVMKAAQDGLLLDGREAAAVIFGGKNGKTVQYMPMVGGILKKIRNSGELASISAHVAYEKDLFEYELGDEEKIIHKPYLGDDRGRAICVYAIAKTKDGAIYRDVMSASDVEKVRSVSRAGKFGPWVEWWDEMAKKTIIRRLAKRLPSSADVDSVIESDLQASGFEQRQPINITPEPDQADQKTSHPSRLKQAIAETEEFFDESTGEVFEPIGNDSEFTLEPAEEA